jgi:hypothetical protein
VTYYVRFKRNGKQIPRSAKTASPNAGQFRLDPLKQKYIIVNNYAALTHIFASERSLSVWLGPLHRRQLNKVKHPGLCSNAAAPFCVMD